MATCATKAPISVIPAAPVTHREVRSIQVSVHKRAKRVIHPTGYHMRLDAEVGGIVEVSLESGEDTLKICNEASRRVMLPQRTREPYALPRGLKIEEGTRRTGQQTHGRRLSFRRRLSARPQREWRRDSRHAHGRRLYLRPLLSGDSMTGRSIGDG